MKALAELLYLKCLVLTLTSGRKLHIFLCIIRAEILLGEATGSFTMSAACKYPCNCQEPQPDSSLSNLKFFSTMKF